MQIKQNLQSTLKGKAALIGLIIMTIMTETLAQKKSAEFTGGVATQKEYHALYVLNNGEEKHIAGTLRNINNALEDPRLKGKLIIELIAFSDGVAVYLKTSPFLAQLKMLESKGVVFVQCENTIKERKISKDKLYDFVNFVPSGNGEIILKSAEGWAIVHP